MNISETELARVMEKTILVSEKVAVLETELAAVRSERDYLRTLLDGLRLNFPMATYPFECHHLFDYTITSPSCVRCGMAAPMQPQTVIT
jgi:hypothetical protein